MNCIRTRFDPLLAACATLALVLVSSCGGKVGGSYAFGAVDGKSLTVNSSFVSYFACPPYLNIDTGRPDAAGDLAIIVLAEAADACTQAEDAGVANAPVPGLTMLLDSYVSMAGLPPPAGTYDATLYGVPLVIYTGSIAYSPKARSC